MKGNESDLPLTDLPFVILFLIRFVWSAAKMLFESWSIEFCLRRNWDGVVRNRRPMRAEVIFSSWLAIFEFTFSIWWFEERRRKKEKKLISGLLIGSEFADSRILQIGMFCFDAYPGILKTSLKASNSVEFTKWFGDQTHVHRGLPRLILKHLSSTRFARLLWFAWKIASYSDEFSGVFTRFQTRSRWKHRKYFVEHLLAHCNKASSTIRSIHWIVSNTFEFYDKIFMIKSFVNLGRESFATKELKFSGISTLKSWT